jgi:hypothetical protein
MDEEYTPHRKALEDGGWLEGGKVIHYWLKSKDFFDYPVSFYVVAFIDYNKMPAIRCMRVFGGASGDVVQVSVDKDVSMSNWVRVSGENK